MLTLDVGCGNFKRGMIGFDIVRNSNIDIIADAHFFPFYSGVFDGIYSFALLEHVDNPFVVLKESFRVLKEHGWIIILLPTDSRLLSDYVVRFLNFDFKGVIKQYVAMRKGIHKWQISEGPIRRLLGFSGFTCLSVFYPKTPFVYGRKGKFFSHFVFRRSHLVVVAVKSTC